MESYSKNISGIFIKALVAALFVLLAGFLYLNSALAANPNGSYYCFWAENPAPPLKQGCNETGVSCASGFEPNPRCNSFTKKLDCNGSPGVVVERACQAAIIKTTEVKLPPQKTPDGVVGATGWRLCGSENGLCSFQATTVPQDVAYGAYKEGKDYFNYIYGIPAAAGSSIQCSNSTFGDPVKTNKKCFARDSSIESLSILGPPGGFTFCAPEGYACTFSGVQDISHGFGREFVILEGMTVGTVECRPTDFHTTLTTGKHKYCYKKDSDIQKLSKAGPGEGYTFCAKEGQPCNFSGKANIKYGAEGKFVEKKEVAGSIDCTNSNFGNPIDKDKACYIVGVATNGPQQPPPGPQEPPPGQQQPPFKIINPLKAGTIPQILVAVGDFLFAIGIALVTVMVLWGGFQILTSAGSSEQIDKGKRTLLWAIIGTVVILIAGGIAELIKDILKVG